MKSAPVCIQGNKALQVCFSETCPSQAFKCAELDCLCSRIHFECCFVSSEVMVKKTLAKLENPEKAESCHLINQVRNILKSSIRSLENQLKILNENVKQRMLGPAELVFLDSIQRGDYTRITGATMKEVESQQHQLRLDISSDQLQTLSKKIATFTNQIVSQMSIIYSKISSSTSKPSNKVSSRVRSASSTTLGNKKSSSVQLKRQKRDQYNLNTKKSESVFLASPERLRTLSRTHLKVQSTIVYDTEFFKLLFHPAQIRSLELLFRASQHKFSVSRFHQECDNISNTLTLLKTEYGCMVGGYTPLPWQSFEKLRKQTDSTLSSFLFSWNLRQKYPLVQADKAIYTGKQQGPNFGHGPDLVIKDNANQQKTSYMRFPSSYSCLNKYEQNKNCWLRLVGDESGKFRVLQWEVFKINLGPSLTYSNLLS